jgi:ElaB/YqjD/DUF883 family membrane-anchored ribosome-binding protein
MTKIIAHRRAPAHSNGAARDTSVGSLKSLLAEARTAISDVGSHASEDIQALRDRLRAQVKTVAKAARRQASRADDVIRAKPYHAIGIAAAIGLIAGLLIARRRSAS